jgi:hypothetical protein
VLLFRNNEIEFLSHISSLKLDNVLGISSMAHAPWDTLGPSLTIVPVKATIIKVLISKTVNIKSSSFSLPWKLLAKKKSPTDAYTRYVPFESNPQYHTPTPIEY